MWLRLLSHRPWRSDFDGVRIEAVRIETDTDKCKKMGILYCVDNMVYNLCLYSYNGND